MLIVSADDDEDFGIYGSRNSNDFLRFRACLVKCVTGVFIVVFPRLASGRRR